MNEIFGILAGVLTALAYIPQITKILKTKSANDLSYIMLFTYMTATACWVIHGAIFKSVSMVVFNAIVFIQIVAIILMKYIVTKTQTDK